MNANQSHPPAAAGEERHTPSLNFLNDKHISTQAGLKNIPRIDQPSPKRTPSDEPLQWFVMRDLKRANAKLPAYKQLSEAGFEVFTPMTTRITLSGSRRTRQLVPFIQDLLFVHTSRRQLDPVVARTETLQYRFVKGAPAGTPMIVNHDEMDRFIALTGISAKVQYLTPAELTPDMLGRPVRVISDGALNGCECRLLSIRGSRKKRILVELPGLLAAAIDASPDFIQLL